MSPDEDFDHDDQEISEALDEDALGVPGNRRATFEELDDVPDFTQAFGDEDDDDALIGEDLQDDEIIELEQDESEADLEDDELEARAEEIEPEFGKDAKDSDQR
jgi:hypothetical protein